MRGRHQGRDVQVSAEALDALCAHDWPGNVRELANALEYALVHADGTTVLPHHLPPEVRESGHAIADSRAESARVPPSSLVQHYYRAPPEQGGNEREVLSRALRESGGKRAATARRLGMSRTTLWKKLKQYGLADAAE
jgi:two-component system response regulator HydG